MFEFEEMCGNKYRTIVRRMFNYKFKINVFLPEKFLFLFLWLRKAEF